MPVDFLTEAERGRWQRLPDTMPQDDLFVFFLLSDEDRQETQRQRDPQNRMGYALQLCILRYLGFVPDDLQATPHDVVAFVAEQLEIDPSVLTLYASRRRSQTDHQLHVQAYLKFRRATPLDFYALHTWLVERALEHDKLSTWTEILVSFEYESNGGIAW